MLIVLAYVIIARTKGRVVCDKIYIRLDFYQLPVARRHYFCHGTYSMKQHNFHTTSNRRGLLTICFYIGRYTLVRWLRAGLVNAFKLCCNTYPSHLNDHQSWRIKFDYTCLVVAKFFNLHHHQTVFIHIISSVRRYIHQF